jgi:hypothetical protein
MKALGSLGQTLSLKQTGVVSPMYGATIIIKPDGACICIRACMRASKRGRLYFPQLTELKMPTNIERVRTLTAPPPPPQTSGGAAPINHHSI